jgi:hypothetical protein
MGGPPAEADEGHVHGQPHHQAPLCAIPYSKSLMLLLLGSSVDCRDGGVMSVGVRGLET